MLIEFSKIAGIGKADILGTSRKSDIVAARHIYWLLLYNSGLSYQDIAKLCNRKTHVVVMQSVKSVKCLLEVNDDLVTGIYNKTKHLIKPDMSKIKRLVELHVPQNIDGLQTTLTDTVECEACHGKGFIYCGGWMEKFKKNIDDPDEQICSCCQGSGKMKVEILIAWSPCVE